MGSMKADSFYTGCKSGERKEGKFITAIKTLCGVCFTVAMAIPVILILLAVVGKLLGYL